MKLRDLKCLPVFYEPAAAVVASVKTAVINDSYEIEYLVVLDQDNQERIIPRDDFKLHPDAVSITDLSCMKPVPIREQSTIYDRKLGDLVFNELGKEIGIITDFVISLAEKRACSVEVGNGVLTDIWQGRKEIPLEQVKWKSITSAVVHQEGSDL